jgi:hypothetical protein
MIGYPGEHITEEELGKRRRRMEASYGGGQGPEGAVAPCMEWKHIYTSLSVAVIAYSYALNLCLPEHDEQTPQCVGEIVYKDKYYVPNTFL